DGKIVIAGAAPQGGTDSAYDFALARYNGDGSLDTLFNGTGKVTTPFGGQSYAYAMALQPDGSIVAVGEVHVPLNDGPALALARYLGDPEAPGLVVTTTADVADPYDFQTSLREAIAYANVHEGADAITFAPGLAGTI